MTMVLVLVALSVAVSVAGALFLRRHDPASWCAFREGLGRRRRAGARGRSGGVELSVDASRLGSGLLGPLFGGAGPPESHVAGQGGDFGGGGATADFGDGGGGDAGGVAGD